MVSGSAFAAVGSSGGVSVASCVAFAAVVFVHFFPLSVL